MFNGRSVVRHLAIVLGLAGSANLVALPAVASECQDTAVNLAASTIYFVECGIPGTYTVYLECNGTEGWQQDGDCGPDSALDGPLPRSTGQSYQQACSDSLVVYGTGRGQALANEYELCAHTISGLTAVDSDEATTPCHVAAGHAPICARSVAWGGGHNGRGHNIDGEAWVSGSVPQVGATQSCSWTGIWGAEWNICEVLYDSHYHWHTAAQMQVKHYVSSVARDYPADLPYAYRHACIVVAYNEDGSSPVPEEENGCKGTIAGP